MVEPTDVFNRFYGAVATRRWEGTNPKISPLGIEFQMTEGVLFDMLYRYFDFEKMITASTQPCKMAISETCMENDLKRIEKLKKELAGGKVKITVKLEVENYVR